MAVESNVVISIQRSFFQAPSAQEKKNWENQNEVCLQVPVTNGITASNLGKSARRDIGRAGYLNLGWWGVSLLPSIGKHCTKIQALGSEKEGQSSFADWQLVERLIAEPQQIQCGIVV